MSLMNIRKQVEVESKKNNDSLDVLAILWNVSVCQEKISIEKEKKKKKEIKKKNTGRIQTKLKAPHVRYNVKILPQ